MNTFISALDWGFGHVTRIIPIINNAIDDKHEVIIGANKRQKAFFKEFFPEVQIIDFPSVSPTYSKKNKQIIALLIYLPRFIFGMVREYFLLKRIIKKYAIERVISDNRYGLYNKKVKSVIITHQLNIQVPGSLRYLKPIVNKLNHFWINRFDACWVPDISSENGIAGTLSAYSTGVKIPVKYLGILSRFSIVRPADIEQVPQLLVIISGPENQRTMFEEAILDAIKNSSKQLNYLIVRGIPEESPGIPNSMNFCKSGQLKNLIQKAQYIVCRSGYSSIMDLLHLKRKALLVPTPGQTEQEYLAKYLTDFHGFIMETQDNIDLSRAIKLLDGLAD